MQNNPPAPPPGAALLLLLVVVALAVALLLVAAGDGERLRVAVTLLAPEVAVREPCARSCCLRWRTTSVSSTCMHAVHHPDVSGLPGGDWFHGNRFLLPG